MNPFFRWSLSFGFVAIGLAFAQGYYGALNSIAHAENAGFIYGVLGMGGFVSLWIGWCAWSEQAGVKRSLAMPTFFAGVAPFLGLAGTILGIIGVLHGIGASAADGSALVRALPAVGTAMWSTVVGIGVLIFLGYQITDLTGDADV